MSWERIYKYSPCDNEVNRHLYDIWSGIKERCLDETKPRYKDYGGRGIKICQEWLNSFDNFVEWALSSGYEIGLTVDRIDNDGDYEPDNCRWLTKREQNRNKRTNLMVEYRGETKPLIVWCEELGLKYDPIHNRITKGWPVEEAFNRPLASECESFSSICRRNGVNPCTARDRILKFGWGFDEAVSTPSLGRGKRTEIHRKEVACEYCGRKFNRHHSIQRFCSAECRESAKRMRRSAKMKAVSEA